MDNLKTGLLIQELRKEKGMTQKDLAKLLHITGRAVSKWERGLCTPDLSTLEPLARALDISVGELITGERMAMQVPVEGLEKTVKEVIAYSENKIIEKTKIVKLITVMGCAAVFAVLLAVFAFDVYTHWSAIFQRGDPLPYLRAAAKITENTPFVQVPVKENATVFISSYGSECPALIDFIEDTWNATFIEQGGAAFLFSTGTGKLCVSSEIYWGRYTVWTVPNMT